MRMMLEPNPEMSSFVFRETLMTHLLLCGNAYAQIIRNSKGEVVALYRGAEHERGCILEELTAKGACGVQMSL